MTLDIDQIMMENAPRSRIERIVSSGSFSDSDLLWSVSEAHPELRISALPFNPRLPEDLWLHLYTSRPKLPLASAVAMAGRPLTENQIMHLMKKEKRAAVWAYVMAHNALPTTLVRQLSAKGRIDTRLLKNYRPMVTTSVASQTLQTQLTQGVAEMNNFRILGRSDMVSPTVNFMIDKLGTDIVKWNTALALLPAFTQSVSELCEVVNSLES